MTADRCPTCDREECPRDEPLTDEMRAVTKRILATAGNATLSDRHATYAWQERQRRNADDCEAHRVAWRARALGLDALLAEERHIAAQTTARLDTILGKLGARDTGNGGQTIEAGDTRIFNDGMRRLDRAIAAAARWRKVAPLIERLRHTRRHAKPDIVVTALDNLLAATEDAP